MKLDIKKIIGLTLFVGATQIVCAKNMDWPAHFSFADSARHHEVTIGAQLVDSLSAFS